MFLFGDLIYMNRKFTRILFILSFLGIVVSCLGDSTYSGSYTEVATFEYTDMDYDYLFGKDSIYVDTVANVGFAWKNVFVFFQNVEDKEFTGGCVLSCLKGEGASVSGADNRFRANGSAGAYGSKTYIVASGNPDVSLMPEHDMFFAANGYGSCTMSGCMVNNTVQVMDSIKTNFVAGDKLLLKATGHLGGAVTAATELVLAEYSALKDSVVSVWTPFDLSVLGTVDHIDFEVISSKPNVPASVCIDNIQANVTITY